MSGRACGKIRYDSEREAERALERIRKLQRRSHQPDLVRTAYECNRCRGWHLSRWGVDTPGTVA